MVPIQLVKIPVQTPSLLTVVSVTQLSSAGKKQEDAAFVLQLEPLCHGRRTTTTVRKCNPPFLTAVQCSAVNNLFHSDCVGI